MKRIHKHLLLLVTTMAMLSICGCENLIHMVQVNDGEIIVMGRNTFNTETMTIQPGTKVVFKPSLIFQTPASITFEGGYDFIAQGTAEEPIVFEGRVNICFSQYGTGKGNFILDHCIIDSSESSSIRTQLNTATIQYCKFTNTVIEGCSPVVQYNDFTTTDNSMISIKTYQPKNDYDGAIIRYNNISGGQQGIWLIYNPKSIEFNNIIGTSSEAINSESDFSINNNYIKDCNGKSGLDTTGEQCSKITYNTYRTTISTEAGCGW